MTRAEGATPRVGDVISYRESGPSGPVTRRGKVVGVDHDPRTDEAVPVVRGGTRGQTRPAAEWDRIVKGAPASDAGHGAGPRPGSASPDAAAELNRRLGRRPGGGGLER
jgi:hypothetical protein